MRRIWLAAICVALLSAGAAGGASREPGPFQGARLTTRTGLYLVVAAVPPFILDVDRGRTAALRGVQTRNLAALHVVPIGATAAVVVAHVRGGPKLYSVRGPGGVVTDLGTGAGVWPSRDGHAVWIMTRAARARCTLRLVSIAGRVVRAPRPFPCATSTDPVAGSLGLVAKRTRVVDLRSGRVVLRTRAGIVAVAGQRLVLDEPHGVGLTLLHATSGARRTLRLPQTIGSLGTSAVDPRGRFVALEFGNPSWTSGTGQAWDVWLLDTRKAELTPLPDLPAFVALKQTNMAWTRDGRLVLLVQSAGKDMVAVWRRGQKRLAVKVVRLPDRSSSGSDSFALLR